MKKACSLEILSRLFVLLNFGGLAVFEEFLYCLGDVLEFDELGFVFCS